MLRYRHKMTVEQQRVADIIFNEAMRDAEHCLDMMVLLEEIGYKGTVKLPALAADGSACVVEANNEMRDLYEFYKERRALAMRIIDA